MSGHALSAETVETVPLPRQRVLATMLVVWACVSGPAVSPAAAQAGQAAQAAQTAPSTPAAPPPVEAFFSNPAFLDARLSPDGKHLAALISVKGERVQLAVLPIGQWDKARVVAGYAMADIATFHWVNNRRLIYSIIDLQSGGGDQRFDAGLFAVDIDGGFQRQLSVPEQRWASGRSIVEERMRPWHAHLVRTLPDAGDHVVIGELGFDDNGAPIERTLLKLDTRTGVASSLTRGGPAGTTQWLVDRDGQPRIASAQQRDKRRLYQRKADGQWEPFAEFDRYTGGDFEPLHIDHEGNLFVVAPTSDGKNALFQYDLKTRRIAEQPLLRLKDFDFEGAFEVDEHANRILGVRYHADAPATRWYDAKLKAAQDRIDTLLPATVNHVSCGACSSSRHLLVLAKSDRDPGSYYVFDRENGQIERIGRVMPAIDPRAMGRRDFVHYRARDGLQIPAWITWPPNHDKSRRYPAVVLVHGGPWVRGGDLLWNAEAQFLATRGYIVIEPEFRGSTGYGFRHFRAGWKQWGLAMQDDLADAVAWAIERKLVDGERVCIAGGSYGGYAALMGVARHADIFQCAISWVGVSDIELMYSIAWSDFSSDWLAYGMPQLIGDRTADAEQLRRTSPLHRAASIRRPLLLAHGGADRRVPVAHSTRFLNAVRPTNPQVEWVEYADEGHGWLLERTRYDFYTRVEKFLDKHIGAPR